MKKYLLYFIIFGLLTSNVHAQEESGLSLSLSRMEREWFHKEFNNDNEEIRISRLEEKVFGTIHDVDKATRYHQLQKAFDAKKIMQAKHKKDYLYGVPTSNPLNIDNLIQ